MAYCCPVPVLSLVKLSPKRKRCKLHLRFADRIIGQRGRAARREAGVVQAVDVALADAVNREGIAAVVAAKARDAVLARAAIVAVEADARIDADDVAHVAVEGRRVCNERGPEPRAGADVAQLHVDPRAGDDDRLVSAGGVFFSGILRERGGRGQQRSSAAHECQRLQVSRARKERFLGGFHRSVPL